MNKLLTRQIKRHFGSLENLPVELKGILNDINNTYEGFEDDSQLLQNSIEISSQELRNAFEKHKLDAETQKETLNKIKEAISVISPLTQNAVTESETATSDSSSMFDSLIRLIEDRKQSEEALLESENRFRLMSDTAPVLIWMAGTDSLCDFFNQTWLDFTGRTLEQELGNGWAEGVHTEDLKACIETYLDAFNARRKFRMEYRLRHADGEYRWLLDNGVPRFTPEGIFIGYIGTCVDITENKRVEETLRNLSLAVEQSPVSIVITDTKGNIKYGNPTAFKHSGYEPEELLGENARIFSSGEKKQADYKLLWETINSGNEWKGEFHNKKKNGELYWEYANISPVKNQNGKIVNFLAVKEDITGRKLMTEALRESEKKYREVVENIKEVIFQTDAAGLWFFLNNAWTEITGFSVEESLGQLFVNYVHPDDRQRNMELFEPLIQRKKDYCRHQIRYLTKDGGFRWIEVFARLGLNEKDEITGTYGTLQDITERKLAEETLQNERSLFRTIIDLIPDAVYVKDVQGRKIIANPKEVQLVGLWSEAEMLNKTDFDLYPSDQAIKNNEEDQYVLQSGKPILNYEGEITDQEGRIHSLLGSKVPLFDVNGKITGIVGVSHDITARKQAEVALQAAHKSLSNILQAAIHTSIISTDINGLITVFSKGAEKMLGYSAEEIVGKTTPLRFHLESELIERNVELTNELGISISGFEVFVAKARIQEHEERTWTYIHKNGTLIYVNLVVTAIRNNNEEVIGFLGIASDITKRKEAEEASLESSKKWEAIISSSPDGIGIVSLDGKLEFMSDKLAVMYGYSIDNKDEYIGKAIFNFIDPSNHQMLSENFRNLVLGKAENRITEYLGIKKDSSRFYADVNSTVLHDSAGIPVNILFIQRDITERKQAERALEQSETLLRSIMDTTSDVIFVKDRECRFVYINPAGCLLNGKTQEQLIGHSKADFETNQEELARFMADDMRIIEMGNNETFEEEVIGADGKLYIFLTTKVPRFDGQGNIIGLIGVAHDITKRKEAEEAFLQSSKKWEAIISASPDGIGMISLDGKLDFMSDKLALMYGYSIDHKDEYIGKNIFDFIDPSDHQLLADNFHDLLEGRGENKITEYMGIKKDNSRFYVDVNSTILNDSTGNPANILFIERDITERKLAEAELEESREKYRGLSEASFEAIFISEKGLCIEQNHAAELMFGYTSEEAMNRYGTDWIVPEDRELVMNKMISGSEEPYEAVALRKDGTTFPCVLNGRRMHYKGKDVRVTSLADISLLKKAEKELIVAKEIAEESELKFRSIIQSQAEGIGFVNQNEVFEFANTASERIFETEENELVGTCLYDYLRPGDREKVDQQTRNRGVGYVNSYELQIITKKGNAKYIHITATPKLDSNNNYLGAYGVFQDITDRKKAEDEVKRVSTRLTMATRAGGIGVWEFGIDQNMLLADEQVFRLFGLEKFEDSNALETWLSGLHPADKKRIFAEIELAIQGKKDFDTEFRVCWPDGTIRNCKALATVLHNDSGKSRRMIGTIWDITEQKKTETILLKARQEAEMANKAKSVFLANMSHEIRTPLNAIIGFSHLLNRDTQLTNSQREYNISIIRASEHLLALINDILELSKMEAGRLELNATNVDLNALLNDIHMIFKESAQSKHLQFIFETAPDLPPYIIVDDNKLRRILINLIGNAIKFTDEGGIAFRTRIDRKGKLKNRLIIEIQDSGPGIPENEIDKLFKHFVQTSSGINKSSGSGLGLALSRELAILMGGDIHVISEVDKGSIFTFEVEIKIGKAEAVQDIGRKRVIGYDHAKEVYRILVVDDLEENLQIVVNLLNMVGFETKEAVNGVDAIAKFEEWNPHLILMDLRMPVMDGYEASRQIKSTEKGKKTPIIALTASSFEDERRKIMGQGLQGHIRKPFRESDLFGTIGNILGIQYIYEDETSGSLEKHFTDEEFEQEISKLPTDLILKMQQAVAAADLDLLINLIQIIDPGHSELSRQLMVLANNFDFDYLKKILIKKEIG